MFIGLSLTICSFLVLPTTSLEDYYWRRFSGDIPDDAVTAATNFGYNLYIGRAPLQGHGIFTGSVVPGLDYILVAYSNNIDVLDHEVEIMCSGHPDNFSWVNATAETLLFNDGLVKGGYYVDSNHGDFYIGRTFFGNQFIVGRVDGFHSGNDLNSNGLTATDGIKISQLSEYEVLIYNQSLTVKGI